MLKYVCNCPCGCRRFASSSHDGVPMCGTCVRVCVRPPKPPRLTRTLSVRLSAGDFDKLVSLYGRPFVPKVVRSLILEHLAGLDGGAS